MLCVASFADVPIEVAVAAHECDASFGSDTVEQGVDVCVSSWHRPAPNTVPAMAKAGGNYLSGQLISMEAKRLGFDEGIGLTPDGFLSLAPGSGGIQ